MTFGGVTNLLSTQKLTLHQKTCILRINRSLLPAFFWVQIPSEKQDPSSPGCWDWEVVGATGMNHPSGTGWAAWGKDKEEDKILELLTFLLFSILQANYTGRHTSVVIFFYFCLFNLQLQIFAGKKEEKKNLIREKETTFLHLPSIP